MSVPRRPTRILVVDSSLRKKLGRSSHGLRDIVTEPGVGFRMTVPPTQAG